MRLEKFHSMCVAGSLHAIEEPPKQNGTNVNGRTGRPENNDKPKEFYISSY